jgi:chemotaxis protein histidine kinase CheA
MPTLSEYFETEARDMLAKLERGLRHAPVPDAGELHRAARAVRGAAQMAREDRVFRAAGALEVALRSIVAQQIAWSADVAARVRATLDDIYTLLSERPEGGDAEAEADALTDAVAARWREAGVQLPPHVASGVEEGVAPAPQASRQFREFAAREVAGIADTLDAGVQELAAAPMDREPLRTILRRQRALLGAARLDEIPVVAEILRAVEDLTRIIAKLDIGVKREWLDIYRVAREGLRSAVGPLERNEDPHPTHALSRLRHMREELLERYGAGEAVSAAHDSKGLVQATAVDTAPEPPVLHDETMSAPPAPAQPAAESSAANDDAELILLDDAVVEAAGAQETAPAAQAASAAPGPAATAAAGADAVSVDQLLYDREGALRRAIELHAAIAAAAGNDPDARAAVDELFDLLRIAAG